MSEGELKNLINELKKEAIKAPNHEQGRLELITLTLDEAKKEFPCKHTSEPISANEYPITSYPTLESYELWFKKWFGDSP
jgi:hypothetical protein